MAEVVALAEANIDGVDGDDEDEGAVRFGFVNW